MTSILKLIYSFFFFLIISSHHRGFNLPTKSVRTFQCLRHKYWLMQGEKPSVLHIRSSILFNMWGPGFKVLWEQQVFSSVTTAKFGKIYRFNETRHRKHCIQESKQCWRWVKYLSTNIYCRYTQTHSTPFEHNLSKCNLFSTGPEKTWSYPEYTVQIEAK